MPAPGDVVPYPPYPAAGASAQGGLQYSLEATQLLAKAVLESIVARLPPTLAADQSLRVSLQNSIVAAVSGNVAVTNMIPAVETGLAKETTLAARASEATLVAVKARTDNLDITLSALRDALRGGKSLSDIWQSLQLQKELSESIWTDNSGAFFIRRVVIDEIGGTFTVTWTDVNGNASVGPGAGQKPLSSPDRETVESLFSAIAGGTGYSSGDILARVLVIDTSIVPPTIVATLWFNISLGTSIGTPAAGTYRQDLGLTDAELRSAPVPVSGTFWQATQPVSGTVAVSNMVPAVETGLAKDVTLQAMTKAEDAAHASGNLGSFILGVRNDDMVARTDLDSDYSPVSVNDKGLAITQDKLSQWFERGKLRVAGGSVVLGVAGTATFRLGNPTGSGKNLLVVAAFLASTAAGNGTVNKNGTLGTPTTLTPWNPNFGGLDTSVAEVQSQAAAATGGSALASSIRIPVDTTRAVTVPFLLIPGTAINFSVALTAGGTVYCNVVYVEGP